MMNTGTCGYAGDRDEAIVDYLYGDGQGATRAAFERHLPQCSVCRTETQGLRGVRQALARWAPPEPIRALEHEGLAGPRLASASPGTRLNNVPLWAQAAAAMLCLGIGMGAANLRVSYGSDGLSVRTGWLQADAPGAAATASGRDDQAAPWRADLTALEQQLRADLQPPPVAPVAASAPADAGNDALLRQIRALIAQSEQRQQRELALRIGDLLNDVQSQRRADLSKIDRSIGLVQNSTGMEVLRQREMLNSLAVRVSQRP